MNKADISTMTEELSVEQQFELQVIKSQVVNLNLEAAQVYVVEVTRQMMVKDNLVKHLLNKS